MIMLMVAVSLLMDLPPEQAFHCATMSALRHAAGAAGVEVDIDLLPTDRVDERFLGSLGGPGRAVVIGPGTPYRSPEAAHAVIRFARERGVPLVAT